jgi:hypothetical protein
MKQVAEEYILCGLGKMADYDAVLLNNSRSRIREVNMRKDYCEGCPIYMPPGKVPGGIYKTTRVFQSTALLLLLL